MKAILVINVPDGYGEITDNKATVNLKNWKLDTSLYVCNVPLKPMPTRKLVVFDPNHCDIEEEIKIINEINGYNRCVDEILGETE